MDNSILLREDVLMVVVHAPTDSRYRQNGGCALN